MTYPVCSAAMYRQMVVLHLDTSGLVHPACAEGAPFQFENAVMIVVLLMLCIVVFLSWVASLNVAVSMRWFATMPPVTNAISRGCFTLLTLFYPLVCNTVLELMHCKLTSVDVDGGVLQRNLLASNSFYICFAGDHFIPGVLAVITLVVNVLGYPLLTMVWIRRYIVRALVTLLPLSQRIQSRLTPQREAVGIDKGASASCLLASTLRLTPIRRLLQADQSHPESPHNGFLTLSHNLLLRVPLTSRRSLAARPNAVLRSNFALTNNHQEFTSRHQAKSATWLCAGCAVSDNETRLRAN